MATARDFVTFALQRAGIVRIGRDPKAAEMLDGINALNDMLQSWTIDGLDLSETLPLDANSTITIADAYHMGVKYNLTLDIADKYGAPASARIVEIAEREKRLIGNQLLSFDDISHESGLTQGYLVSETE